MDAFMKGVLNVKPFLLKQNAHAMDAFQQRLFNSQRETYFLLKPDAPKTNAFHVKDVVNIEPFLFDTMPPKIDAFMKDVLNVKPVLLKPFSKDFLILSVKPIFCWNLMPPKPMPFMSKMLSTLNLFCLTQCPQNGCLYERCFQCEASSFKAKCPPDGMPFSKDFLILSVKPIFCWNLMPPKPMPFLSKMLSTLKLFCLTQCPQNGCLYERCSQCEASSFKAKCPPNGCLLWQLFLMRNLFLFHMMLPTWMPFLSKRLSTLNPFCLTYCPWNRWWQMFSMSTPCFVRPSFGKDALNFEHPFDRDILHAKCSPALWNKGPPEWARALFSGIQNYFQGLWLFHLALAVYPDPAKSFQNAASAWRYVEPI